MAILATSIQLNPPVPPTPPIEVEPELLKGYYMLWNFYKCELKVAKAPSDDIASEMANFLYDRNGTYYLIYSNAISTILADVATLKQSTLLKAYVTFEGDVIEYKTRIDLINDFLAEN